MADTTLRARSATEIVDAALALYTRNFSQYIVVTAVAYSPALIASLLIGENPANLLMLLGSLTVAVIGSALMTGSVVSLGSRVYLGESVDVAAAMRQALRKVPALVVVAILLTAMYSVGLLLFVVGFVYVGVTYFGASAAVVLENKSIFGAFARSSWLTSGNKGHVLLTLFLVYAIYLLVSWGLSIAGAIIGNHVLTVLVVSFYTIVAYPVVGLTVMILFYDLRIRREGFDLERMAQSLGGPAPADSVANPVR